MLGRLLILFTIVPLLELWLLVWLSEFTSTLFTVTFVLVTGVAGASLSRLQGWRTWRQIRDQLAQGQVPTGALLDGLLIFIAGALLITPGILTDLVGFGLLIPPIRHAVRLRLTNWLKARAAMHVQSFGMSGFADPQPVRPEGTVIDAEFTRQSSENEPR